MCTSFAAYFNEPIYGMDFDLSERELKFTIETYGDSKVFFVSQKENGSFLHALGMNSHGIFSNMHMVDVEELVPYKRSPKNIHLSGLFDQALKNAKTVDDVLEIVSDKRLVNPPNRSLHSLYADTDGNARVFEVGQGQNEICEMENGFIVMTNFPNAKFRNRDYQEVQGSGADRYKIAYQYLLNSAGHFGVEQAFDLLQRTAQQNGDFPTLCSFVFLPSNKSVLMALMRNFSKIWKVSLAESSIESYQGFDEHLRFELGKSGIRASKLLRL